MDTTNLAEPAQQALTRRNPLLAAGVAMQTAMSSARDHGADVLDTAHHSMGPDGR